MNANQWDAIRQLDENDSPVELAAAIGELLDEHEAAQAESERMRPVYEAAKAWRRHAQNHGAAVIICRTCQAKDAGFCDEHNMSDEVLLVLEGELEAAIDAATAKERG